MLITENPYEVVGQLVSPYFRLPSNPGIPPGLDIAPVCSQIGNMRVISPRRLREFWTLHADSETALRAWLAIVRKKDYRGSHQVRNDFPSASFLGNWRTVFNIRGNKYRLVVDIRYDLGRIYIRHVLTHEEYDRRTRQGLL